MYSVWLDCIDFSWDPFWLILLLSAMPNNSVMIRHETQKYIRQFLFAYVRALE